MRRSSRRQGAITDTARIADTGRIARAAQQRSNPRGLSFMVLPRLRGIWAWRAGHVAGANATWREARKTRKTGERLIRDGKLAMDGIADYPPARSLDEIKEITAGILQPT